MKIKQIISEQSVVEGFFGNLRDKMNKFGSKHFRSSVIMNLEKMITRVEGNNFIPSAHLPYMMWNVELPDAIAELPNKENHNEIEKFVDDINKDIKFYPEDRSKVSRQQAESLAEKLTKLKSIFVSAGNNFLLPNGSVEVLENPSNKTMQDVAEGETWAKHNNPRAGGMSKKSVKSYRRSHPGSKIQTAVTTKPSKLKKGSKAAARRKSFCARMKGMKKHNTSAKTAHDPNSNINKSLRRWHCESVEQMQELVILAEQFIATRKK